MRRALFGTLAGLAACLPAGRVVASPPPPLLDALKEALEKPTKRERAAAAANLAGRGDLDLELWLATLPKLPPTGPEDVGIGAETVALPVGTGLQQTKVAWYVPKSRVAGKPGPLMLALHGQGGLGEDEVARWQNTADALGMVVVAPTDPKTDEGYRFTAEERGTGLATLQWARRRFDVDENRVFIAGVSRGGHMTWDVATRFPTPFAAMVPLIGAPRVGNKQPVNNLRYVENVVGIPIRDLQGSLDDPRAVENVRMAFQRLKDAHAADVKLIEFAAKGHDFEFSAVDWPAFLGGCKRDPEAARVVRLAARADEGRASWAEILEYDKTVAEIVVPVAPPGWDKMTEEAQRAFVLAETDKRTARLEVVRLSPGQFRAASTGVKRFRLLLTKSMLEPGKPVVVTWNGKAISRNLAPSKAVLLAEFVEHFDRCFLPVVEFQVP